MLDTADIVQMILISTLDASSMMANVFYIYTMVQKTPKTLRPYSMILLNIAVVDFAAAFCSLMCIASLQNVSGRMVFSYLGPCTLLNSRWCHLFFAIHANFDGQALLLLFTSFCYRLWVLRTDIEKQQRDRYRWVIALCGISCVIFLNTVALYYSGTYPESKDRMLSQLDLTGEFTRKNLLTRFSTFLLIFTYNVAYFAVFAVRGRLFAGIRVLSISDRHNHQLIYRSLTAQMLSPLIVCGGCSLWFLDVLGLVHSRTLHQSIFILSSLFALASPLMNMYFIPPYRNYLNTLLYGNRRIEVQEMTESTTQNSMSRF